MSERSLEWWWRRWVDDGLDGLTHLGADSLERLLAELAPGLAQRVWAAVARVRGYRDFYQVGCFSAKREYYTVVRIEFDLDFPTLGILGLNYMQSILLGTDEKALISGVNPSLRR